MVIIIPRHRGGTWKGVAVANWCREWICRMRGGLVHHIIKFLLRYLSRCCEVLQLHQQYFKMTGFVPESPIFSSLQQRWSFPSILREWESGNDSFSFPRILREWEGEWGIRKNFHAHFYLGIASESERQFASKPHDFLGGQVSPKWAFFCEKIVMN